MADGGNSGGNNITLLIGIAILMIVIAGVTSYGFMVYLQPGGGGGNGGQDQAQSKNKIGKTYSLGDFIVNLKGAGSYKFIKASITVEITKSELTKELEERNPQIWDKIISILRAQELEDIEEPGTTALKNKIKSQLNNVLTKGKISSVWFTKLVVQ